jgi:hypothetical protein
MNRLAVLVILSGLWGVADLPAHAAAYKCTTATGSITFSDIPCPTTVAKGEKVLGRGAGSNPLNAAEKAEFKEVFLSSCKAPPNICACVNDYLVESLTYEEVMQSIRSKNQGSKTIEAKTRKAVEFCKGVVR